MCAFAPAFAQQSAERQAIVDAVDAANWQLRLDLFHDQLNAGQAKPEMVKKSETETAAVIARLRGKWANTNYRATFESTFQRALKDPGYRNSAVADYDRNPGGSSNSPGTSPQPPAPQPAQPSLAQGIEWAIRGVIVLALVGIVWGVIRAINRPKPVLPPPKKDTTYGSAEWAQPVEAPPSADYVFGGVFFGKSSLPEYAETPLEGHQGGPICSEKKTHVLICAQARTGKGTRVAVPTLLRYQGQRAAPGAPLQGSVFCIDPKGENAVITARARRAFPSDVNIINPWGELAAVFQQYGFLPATYNPLDILNKNDPNVVSTAQAMAAAICPQEAGGKNNFWNQNAASILTAVLLWLTVNPQETKTLGRAREILTRSKKDFQDNYLSHMAASTFFNGAISEHAAPFVGMAQETYSGIMSNVQQYTTFLSDPQIKAATAASTFSMQDLLTKSTTLYLVVPPEKMDMQRTWLRLLITAGMWTYKRHGSSNANRCLFLIDELISLGLINELPNNLAMMSGYGIDFVLIVQALDQIKEVYGDKGYGAIMSNCAYKWFCNVSDLYTADYLSKAIGQQTVVTKGQSVSTTASPGGGSSGTSTNYGLTGRPLLMPDEILKLGRDAAILLSPGKKPDYLRTVDYWNLTKAFGHLEKQFPGMYWKPPITWDKNPLPH